MPEYLSIEARLPQTAGLEFAARLMAARPHWDVEADEAAVRFSIPLIHGLVDAELAVVEEAALKVERKNVEFADFWVRRVFETPVLTQPNAISAWRLQSVEKLDEAPAPRPDRLLLPPKSTASARFWAGESLALSAVAGHLTPPPGAPETRGKAVLVLGHTLPLAPIAALLIGAAEAALISDEAAGDFAKRAAALNGRASALATVTEPFAEAAQKRGEWRGHFGLIVLHLSPYLATRRIKTVVNWLAEDGALIISGFAPGPQTAHLLRAAARAGLCLSASNTLGAWAAMKLELAPKGEDLPPLTGSVVPALVDLPPEEQAAREEEIPDEDSLMPEEEEEETDESVL